MGEARHFRVSGRVQGVMFRQTLIRAAQKRALKAGATNLPSGEVAFRLEGDPQAINALIDALKGGERINSWGARVARLEALETGRPLQRHQVTTENVDSFNWKPNVEMYL